MKRITVARALLLSLCAVLLVVGSVWGTVAFLKSSDSVKNTFTVGKVAITLDEAQVNEYGLRVEGAARVKENTYKLIPGHTYTKDPTVHFAPGSEASWLFVKVENGLSEIETDTTIAAQIAANGWAVLEGNNGIYYKKVAANETNAAIDYPVFATFIIAGTADVASYENAEINVTAYAIQADGFDTAAAAWTAGSWN